MRVARVDLAPRVHDRDHGLAREVLAVVAHLERPRAVAEGPQVVDPVPAMAAQLRRQPASWQHHGAARSSCSNRSAPPRSRRSCSQRGLRNVFLHGLKPLTPHRMAGPAFTLRYIPAREDIDTLDVFKDYDHPQRKAIEDVPPGHVLVMDCRGQTRAASAGGILLTRLQARGAGGPRHRRRAAGTRRRSRSSASPSTRKARARSPTSSSTTHGHQRPDRLRGGRDLPRRHHGRRRGGRRLRAAAPGGGGRRSGARAGEARALHPVRDRQRQAAAEAPTRPTRTR